MIVIEGMDNSGKSTLGLHLVSAFKMLSHSAVWRIQESEGPPKSDDEINDRSLRYNSMDKVVFIRHPVISNAIYGKFRPNGDPIRQDVRDAFWSIKPLIIYCDAGMRGLGGHVEKDHDDPIHLAMLERRYNALLTEYRLGAAQWAHMVYRIGDDVNRILEWVVYARESL